MKRYSIDGVFFNGHGWEAAGKDVPSIESALGAASLLLRETRPYQVIITDREYKTPIPNPAQIIADQLNEIDTRADNACTLDDFDDMEEGE